MHFKTAFLASFALVGLCSSSLYAQQPNANDPNNPANPGPPPGAMRFQVAGGGGNVMVMPSGPMMNRDMLSPLIMILGELNLAPDFNLSPEQKQKIQTIRDDFKGAMDAFRKDHADELKQLDDQQQQFMQDIQAGNLPDPSAMMELAEQRRAIMQNAPDGSDHATQVRAVLDAEQLKKVEAKEAAQAKEREEMQQRFPMMRMGGNGGGAAGGGVMVQPANPPVDPNDKPKEKDKDGKGR